MDLDNLNSPEFTPKKGPEKEAPNLPLRLDLFNLKKGLAGSYFIHSDGKKEMAKWLAEELNNATQNDRSKDDIKNYIKLDFESPITKNNNFRSLTDFTKSKESIEAINPEDTSGATLSTYLGNTPEETKLIEKEIENRLREMENIETVKDTLENQLSGFCEDIWEKRKDTTSGAKTSEFERIKLSLIGPEPSKDDKEQIDSIKTPLFKTKELAELICLEQARIIYNGISKSGIQEHNAIEIFGEEYHLIKGQVNHMTRCLTEDFLKSDAGQDIINPKENIELLSPLLQGRMKKKDIEEMEKNPLKSEQLSILNSAYSTVAFKKKENPGVSETETSNELISFILASIAIIEEGKRAKYANQLKELRELESSLPKETKIGNEIENEVGNKMEPKETEITEREINEVMEKGMEPKENEKIPKKPFGSNKLRSSSKTLIKKGAVHTKDGMVRILKQWPQILAAPVGALTYTKLKEGHNIKEGDMLEAYKVFTEKNVAIHGPM